MKGILKASDSLRDAVLLVAEGDKDTFRLLTGVLAHTKEILPEWKMGEFMSVLLLDDLGLRGHKAWILYEVICEEDLKVFIDLLFCVLRGFISREEVIEAVEGGSVLNIEYIEKELNKMSPRKELVYLI